MALLKARFKFKGDMSADLKEVLKRNGFSHYAGHPDWLMYVKIDEAMKPNVNKIPPVVLNEPDWRGLSDEKQAELNRCCNRIVDKYPGDLSMNRDKIRVRVTNLAKTREPRERDWMLDWVRRVVDEE